MKPINISPNLVYIDSCPLDLTPLAERSAKLLDKIVDAGEVEKEGGVTSTGHLDAHTFGQKWQCYVNGLILEQSKF